MRRTYYCFFILLLPGSLFAQDPYYFLSIEESTYASLEEGVSLSQGVPWDDPDFNIPIGFEFDYFGKPVTELNLGEEFLGGILSADGEADTAHLFIVYGSDLIDRGVGTTNGQSEIQFALEGDPGSRIFKLEWRNAGFYNELVNVGLNESFVNLQFWLFEASQAIEIHFGPSQINPDYFPHDGFPGPLIALVENFHYNTGNIEVMHGLFGDPTNPDLIPVGMDGLDTLSYFLEGNPPSGTVYRFNSPLSSIFNTPETLNVQVFPTVTQGPVQLILADKKYDEGEVVVFNTVGQMIQQRSLADTHQQLDLSPLPTGLYLVQVRVGNSIHTERVYKR
ncbi:MAG: T9SS type A sorting domain-containing protein [Bacteroidota bacterium]